MIASIKSRWLQLRCMAVTLITGLDRFATAHETALFWGLGIFYKFVLEALYIWAASPQYAYAGLVYSPNFFKYVVASLMYLVLFAYLPKREHDTVAFLFHLQFVYSVAPMLAFYSFSDSSSRYMAAVFLCVLLQIFLIRRPAKNSLPVHIKGIRNYVTVAFGVLVIFVLLVPVLYNGFNGLAVFDFSYIYQMRANTTYPPGFGYLLNWTGKVILPFACLMFLHQKKYRWLLAAVVLQLLLYMETGQKIILFILVPILAIYLLSKTGHLLKLMYLGLALLFLGVILAYRLDKAGQHSLGIMLNSLIAIRAIFHPADNKFTYYECFSQYPKLYFSDGQIGRMLGLTYPYQGSVGQVVYAFTGGTFKGSNTNTGYLGESYAQMGFLGMLLMSLLLVLLLRSLRTYDTREHTGLLTALFAIYMIILNDNAFLTTLFTGGLLLAYLLVFIYFSKHSEGVSNGIQRN